MTSPVPYKDGTDTLLDIAADEVADASNTLNRTRK
jgi:hypothetical protein